MARRHMISKEDFECLRDCDNYTREFTKRLERQGVIFWTNKTVRIPHLKLVLTKHDLKEVTRSTYEQIFKGHQIRVIWYFDYADLKEVYGTAATIGGKGKKKTGAVKKREKLEERRKSFSKTIIANPNPEEAGPSGTQVNTLNLLLGSSGNSDTEPDFGSDIDQLFSSGERVTNPADDSTDEESEDDTNSLDSQDEATDRMADGQGQAANVPAVAGNLGANIRHMIGQDYVAATAIADLRDRSSMYWMQDLIDKNLTGSSVYRELIFKNNERVAALSQEDKNMYLPMLISVVSQSRMVATNEAGRVPLQVLIIAEMTGLYQEAKTADPDVSRIRLDAACLAILENPDTITCCEMTGARRPVDPPVPNGNVPAPGLQENQISRADAPGIFAEVMRKIRADRESKPLVSPIAAYTCAVTAMAKKGMVSQNCLDKILEGVRADLGKQITLSIELVRRYHDRFPITLTRENVAARMKAIEDILPEENLRLKIIIRQAALSGLTCITTIKKAMDVQRDFFWGQACALFPNEATAAAAAFDLIGGNPYYGFTSNMEGVASNRYKNLAFIAKEVLIRYHGETDLRNYAGFPKAPMYPDKVERLFTDYNNRGGQDNLPAANDELLNTLRASAAPFGY